MAVGVVVKNRVLSDSFPDSICKVESQRNQFSYTRHVDMTHVPNTTESVNKAVQAVMSSDQWPTSYNVLFYHTDAVVPPWDYSKIEHKMNVGDHLFYSCIDDDVC